jgi:ATP-dependent Clp protease ATP-binding subunit ClpA
VFERFGRDTRTAVVLAVEEAKALGVDRVRPEHLLVGLALEREGPAAALLAEHGLDQPTTRRLVDDLAGADLDGEALAAVGIDVDQVRDSVEQSFGRGALDRVRRRPKYGHIPFSRPAKQALVGALRVARTVSRRQARIDGIHLLISLLDSDDRGVSDLLQRSGVDPARLRAAASDALAA